MKERFIQGKLDSITKKLEEVKSKKETAKLITGLATIGAAVFAVSTTFSAPYIALASLIATGAFGLAYYNSIKIYDVEIDRLNKEQKHLETIKNKTPEATTELNKKRLKKLKALDETCKKQNESYETAECINVLLRVTQIVGAGLTLANPWLSLIGIGGLALNLISSKYMINKKKDIENTLLRYNNINNDLNTIINDEKDKQDSRIGTRKIMKPSSNTNQKTNQRPLPSRNTNILKQPTQIYNTQAVNNYVNNLTKQNNQQKTNQKVKN